MYLIEIFFIFAYFLATTKQIAIATYFGKSLNRLPPEPWPADHVYIPWAKGNVFEVIGEDILYPDEIQVRRLTDGAVGYIDKFACVITTHPVDEGTIIFP